MLKQIQSEPLLHEGPAHFAPDDYISSAPQTQHADALVAPQPCCPFTRGPLILSVCVCLHVCARCLCRGVYVGVSGGQLEEGGLVFS